MCIEVSGKKIDGNWRQVNIFKNIMGQTCEGRVVSLAVIIALIHHFPKS